jgi:hypothetical protein
VNRVVATREPKPLVAYLNCLRTAIIKIAPPWPKDAERFMEREQVRDLCGWYDDPNSNGQARIYINPYAKEHLLDPNNMLHTLMEEVVHHVDNDLNDSAAKAKATSLMAFSRIKAELGLQMLKVLLLAYRTR